MVASGALVTLAAGIAAVAVTRFILANAERLKLVQAPNARSSHAVPTPTGGGVGIVAGGTVGCVLALAADPWSTILVVALSLAMATMGFIDDRRPVPAGVRLGVQVVLVITMILALRLDAIGAALNLSTIGIAVTISLVIAAVYWINIFNFMDGIDGLAGAEAAFMLLGAALLSWAAPGATAEPQLWWMLALAAATVGFLVFNFPPARIFMGDVGSTYLGLMLVYFALVSLTAGWMNGWQWLILAALFMVDASVTLVRRLMLRERVFEAHRRHAYQRLSRRWGGHRPVTLAAIAINVLWLLPLAWWAGAEPAAAWMAGLAAYLPLVVIAWLVGAGAREMPAA